jgi:uncharacterized protein (DUF1330 family)
MARLQLYVVVSIDLSRADLTAFELYESAVLPLIAEHGGAVLHRLRRQDQLGEVHLIAFPGDDEYGNFSRDPRRLAQASLFEASRAIAAVNLYTPMQATWD